MSMSVDRGENVTLSCTYNSTQQELPNIMWNTPPGIFVMPVNTTIGDNSLQSNITFTAASSSYAGDYQCTAIGGSTQLSSDTATLTLNCKF